MYVAQRHGITDAALLADVLAAYRELTAYPEVPAMLAALRDAGRGTRHSVQRRARHAGRRGAIGRASPDCSTTC